MICEFCDQLQIADGNLNLHPFSCKESGRRIFDPHIQQKWCPKVKKRNAKTPKQDFTIQTDFEEMKFVDSLSQDNLKKYIETVILRDPELTDFNIPMLQAYAKGKIK